MKRRPNRHAPRRLHSHPNLTPPQKNYRIMKRFLLLSLLLVTALATRSQSVTLTVAEPGTLSDMVSTTKKDVITGLKVIGEVNADDIHFINDMKNLEDLDLSDAHIIASEGHYNGKALASHTDTKLNTVSEWMFYNHNNYRSIVLPNSVVTIEWNAFGSCNNLRSLTLGPALRSVAKNWDNVLGCRSLEAIYVAPENPSFSSIDGVLFSKDGKTLVFYPEQHTTGTYAIPDGTERIEERAFYTSVYGLGLRGLVIPASVTQFPDEMMSHAPNLGSIYAENPTPPQLTDRTFNIGSAAKEVCTLYVPAGSRDAYWLAKGWGDFANIVEGSYVPTGIGSPATETTDAPSLRVEGTTLTADRPTTLAVYDARGKVVYKGQATTVRLSPGTYVVKAGRTTLKVVL